MSNRQPSWKVLLIGGPSGVGKSIVAKSIGLRFGVPWLEVDDLRLALQRSRVTLPRDTAALYFFSETPDVWKLPPEHLCNCLIAVGEVMSPAIEVVVENHIDDNAPVIIEGDGILPSLLARPSVRDRTKGGEVRAVFLVEPDEEMLIANIAARGREMAERSKAEQHTAARTKWLHGQWLAKEAHHYHLPVLEPRPWSSLIDRIIASSSTLT